MNEIVLVGPRIFIYVDQPIKSFDILKENGFTHLLFVSSCVEADGEGQTTRPSSSFQQLSITVNEDYENVYLKAHEFIESAEKVLIFSFEGASLSLAVAVAHFFFSGRFSDVETAFSEVRTMSVDFDFSSVKFNDLIMNQLKNLAERLKVRPQSGVRVESAQEGQRLIDARRLIRAYADSLPFDLDFQNFAKELASLPAEYVAERGGHLVVAVMDSERGPRSMAVAGIRRIDAETAELKRFFVAPATRRMGLGRLLATHLLQWARDKQYNVVKLDTVAEMVEARSLYQDLGFEECDPYIYNPLPTAKYYQLKF